MKKNYFWLIGIILLTVTIIYSCKKEDIPSCECEKEDIPLCNKEDSISTPVSDINTKIIAHRGYFNTPGSAENSLTSLIKASKIGVFGSECDVYITLDGIPVVHHDGFIKEFGIQNTNYNVIQNIKLANGEILPTLSQYLKTLKALDDIILFLEIKPHNSNERNMRAANIVSTMVKEEELENRVVYISFSLDICKELIRISPKTPVGYLNGDLKPLELKNLGFSGLCYYYPVIINNLNWICEAKEIGLSVSVWTINSQEQMEYFIKQGVDFVITDEPILLMDVINNCKQSN